MGAYVARPGDFQPQPCCPQNLRDTATLPRILEELQTSGEENVAARLWPSKHFVSTPLKTCKRQRRYAHNVREMSTVERNLQILWKRVPTWRRLSHENIMPFRGVNMTFFQLALVYDWGQNGNINQYIVSHPGASRPSLVRKALATAPTTTNG